MVLPFNQYESGISTSQMSKLGYAVPLIENEMEIRNL